MTFNEIAKKYKRERLREGKRVTSKELEILYEEYKKERGKTLRNGRSASYGNKNKESRLIERINERLIPNFKKHIQEAKIYLRRGDKKRVREALDESLDIINEVESVEPEINTEADKLGLEQLLGDLIDTTEEIANEVGITIADDSATEVPTDGEVEEPIMNEELEAIYENLKTRTDKRAFRKLIEAASILKRGIRLIEQEQIEAAAPVVEEAAEAAVAADAVPGVSEEVKANIEGVIQAIDALKDAAGIPDEVDPTAENPEAAIPPTDGQPPAEEQPLAENKKLTVKELRKRLQERNRHMKKGKMKEGSAGINTMVDAILDAAGVPNKGHFNKSTNPGSTEGSKSQIPEVSNATATKGPANRINWPNRPTKSTPTSLKEGNETALEKRLRESEEAALNKYMGIGVLKFKELKEVIG